MPFIVENMHVSRPFFSSLQVPCVTCSGLIHSLRWTPINQISFLGLFFKSIQLCGCFELNISCLILFLFHAEWPFHQQERSELSVWARCDRTIPQPEQAGLHRAKSWGQSWGLWGHSFREVHHRVFSTQLLVGINAGGFSSHPLLLILHWFYSAFSQWSDGKQRSLYPPQGIRPQARVSPVHCCGESPVLHYSCY